MAALAGKKRGTAKPAVSQRSFFERARIDLSTYKYAYLMLVPVLAWYVIFVYWPMAGNVIAFKDFMPARGIWGSPWIGFTHFTNFFGSFFFFRLIRNTVLISFYGILFAFPIPILLAIMLNEIPYKRFKKTVQTITYMPFFISMIVFCGIIIDFLKMDGVLTVVLSYFGLPNQNWLMIPEAFRAIFVGSNIWQTMGWNSIIFLAALANIDQELFEAARVDGAGRLRQIWHITLPGILPITMILLIIRMGAILSVGFEQIILLQNDANMYTSEVIASFVYNRGILDANFSFATAVGLFNSVVNFSMVIAANTISRRLTSYSLW